MAIPCILAWSGGKDSALALHRILQDESYELKGLLSTLSGHHQRISMHGVREELLDQQAERIGLPLKKVFVHEGSYEEYERQMEAALKAYRAEGVEDVVFGDIFLEDLREYREKQLERVAMRGVFPLWKEDTKELLEEAYRVGIRTLLCSCKEGTIGVENLGKQLTPELAAGFPEGVDPCGEYGEFHSFVIDAPYYKSPIELGLGERVVRSYEGPEGEGEIRFHYQELLPKGAAASAEDP